jgi:small conductance mechanosensitive channel
MPSITFPMLASIVIPFIFKLIGAVALWIVGNWFVKLALSLLKRSLIGGRLDPTLISYLINIFGAVLRIILVVAILGFFGVQTASFAALLAGAGVAIGAAWSGMLSNFAAGVFLQIFRPFAVGNFIAAGGVTGTVEDIDIFVTSIKSPENVRNIVPNAKLFSDTIQNFSTHTSRRVDLVAQLDHSADVEKAMELLKQGLKSVPNQDPSFRPTVEVLEFNERGPRLAVRPYAHANDYAQVYFDTNRMIANVLGRNGFPTPRIPVAMVSGSGATAGSRPWDSAN